MSTRRSTWFYGLLLAFASIIVGMVLAARLELSPRSAAQTLAVPPANSAPLSGPVDATTFRNIAKMVSPAVVNIKTESRQRTLSPEFDLEEFLEQQRGGGSGGRRVEPRERKVTAAGTGFVIDKSGLILTNNHVVEGATKILVSLYGEDDDQTYAARIVGLDPLTDSALIELTEKPDHALPEIKFGDSAQMQPGDWVMAIGNPFGFSHTVSVGVISGIGRQFGVSANRSARVIQTDAAINPGNSGGPLLNLRGEVIGVNTAIYADANRQSNIGIGFAMPINLVRDILPQLRTGKITRGRIGIRVEDVKTTDISEMKLKNRDGAVVAGVLADSAAKKAGLLPGDVILTFNGKPVRRSDDLVSMVTATKPGSTVPLRVVRDGQERPINITVDELDIEKEVEQSGRQVIPGGDLQDPPTQNKDFGIQLENITPAMSRQLRLPDARGAIVTDVDPDGPAAGRLDLRDVITRVGDVTVASAIEAQREFNKVKAGSTARVWIIREGEQLFLTLRKE